jgi:hypothetical protein
MAARTPTATIALRKLLFINISLTVVAIRNKQINALIVRKNEGKVR